jgi:hypothetical protein
MGHNDFHFAEKLEIPFFLLLVIGTRLDASILVELPPAMSALYAERQSMAFHGLQPPKLMVTLMPSIQQVIADAINQPATLAVFNQLRTALTLKPQHSIANFLSALKDPNTVIKTETRYVYKKTVGGIELSIAFYSDKWSSEGIDCFMKLGDMMRVLEWMCTAATVDDTIRTMCTLEPAGPFDDLLELVSLKDWDGVAITDAQLQQHLKHLDKTKQKKRLMRNLILLYLGLVSL